MTDPKATTENARLSALSQCQVLDTPPEPSFDGLVALAAQVCRMPIALISFIDAEREWIKAQIGWPIREIPHEESIGAFTLEREEAFVLGDLTQVEPFRDFTYVRSAPHLRFYAGLALRTPDGHAVGTLSVMDHQPGELSPERLQALDQLARQADALLASRQQICQLERTLSQEKQTEDALRQTEEMYHDIFDNIMEGIYLSTPNGYYLSVNRMLARIYGYDSPEELTAAINDIKTELYVDPDRRTEFLQLMQENGVVTKFESQVYRKDGSIIWISENARTVRDSNGTVLYFEGTVDDITDRRRAEEALRNSEALYHSLVESLPQHIFRKDLQGRFTFGNKKFCETLGRPLEEIVGKTDFDFFPPELARKYQMDDQQLLASGSTFETTEEHVGPARERMFVHVVKTLLYDGDGHVIGLQGIFWDVTQHKKMEETLQRERDLHQALMDSSPDSIFFKDLDSRFLKCSRALATRLGLRDPDEAVGKTDFDFLPREKAQEFYEEEQRIVKTGQPILNKIERQSELSGESSWASVTKFPIYNQANQITGIVGLSRDISRLKQTEAELEKARDAALQSVRIKSEFLANVSHEIRTPMNGIIGMTGLLLDTDLSEEQREFAKNISDSAEALLTLVNDILDFSKMEAGKLTLESIQFNLRELVEGTVEIFADRAQSKHLELACWIHKDVPLQLEGDPGRLRQILINLLGNALKFTKEGEVVVEVVKENDTTDTVTVCFAIEDTGIGISEDALPRLFQAFTQADGSMARQYEGTGLGLAIVHQLVDMMQGELDVRSTPEHGSTFWFRIPLRKAPAPEPASPKRGPTPELTGLQGLVVDNNLSMQRVLHHYLTSWGVETETTADPEEALSRMRLAATSEHPIDMIVIDLDLESPQTDGITLIRQIKADPKISQCTAVLLTPVGYHIAQEDLQAGVAATIAKPVKYHRLKNAIIRAIGGESGSATAGRSSKLSDSGMGVADLRILLAEDNVVNRNVALRQLQKLGLDPDTAANGLEVLEKLKTTPYDVILMDCQMPEMDGYKTTRQIRNREKQVGASQRIRPPYIIAMTANALKGDREKCLAVGMNDYLSKPVRQQELATVLQRAGLNVIPSNQGPSRPQTEAETSEARPESESAPILDQSVIESLRELREGDETNPVAEMAELFYQDASKRIEALEEAGMQQDTDALISMAHALKGSASNLGARRLAEVCATLEQEASQGNLKEAQALLNTLKREYEALREALEQAEQE